MSLNVFFHAPLQLIVFKTNMEIKKVFFEPLLSEKVRVFSIILKTVENIKEEGTKVCVIDV